MRAGCFLTGRRRGRQTEGEAGTEKRALPLSLRGETNRKSESDERMDGWMDG